MLSWKSIKRTEAHSFCWLVMLKVNIIFTKRQPFRTFRHFASGKYITSTNAKRGTLKNHKQQFLRSYFQKHGNLSHLLFRGRISKTTRSCPQGCIDKAGTQTHCDLFARGKRITFKGVFSERVAFEAAFRSRSPHL